MYSQIVTTFDPMLSSLRYFHNDINKVTVYIDNGIKHDTTIAPIEEIENEPFFDMASDSTAINWYVDKSLYLQEKCQHLNIWESQVLCI